MIGCRRLRKKLGGVKEEKGKGVHLTRIAERQGSVAHISERSGSACALLQMGVVGRTPDTLLVGTAGDIRFGASSAHVCNIHKVKLPSNIGRCYGLTERWVARRMNE